MNPWLPYEGELHPWFSVKMHEECNSRLPIQCELLGISIHDREKVYDEMKKAEQKLLFPTK